MVSAKAKDETGSVYGRLTVLERADNVKRNAAWLCQCECGRETVVQGRHLRNGDTQSCGCLHKEAIREAAILRGALVTDPTYSTVHKRITRERGRAAEYTCVDCGLDAAEWSYDGLDPEERRARVGRYVLAFSTDSERYAPRCYPCHARYDGNGVSK